MKERERQRTPEEQRRKCLNCEPMADFIKGLQGEIKRLQVSFFILRQFQSNLKFLFIGLNE